MIKVLLSDKEAEIAREAIRKVMCEYDEKGKEAERKGERMEMIANCEKVCDLGIILDKLEKED